MFNKFFLKLFDSKSNLNEFLSNNHVFKITCKNIVVQNIVVLQESVYEYLFASIFQHI